MPALGNGAGRSAGAGAIIPILAILYQPSVLLPIISALAMLVPAGRSLYKRWRQRAQQAAGVRQPAGPPDLWALIGAGSGRARRWRAGGRCRWGARLLCAHRGAGRMGGDLSQLRAACRRKSLLAAARLRRWAGGMAPRFGVFISRPRIDFAAVADQRRAGSSPGIAPGTTRRSGSKALGVPCHTRRGGASHRPRIIITAQGPARSLSGRARLCVIAHRIAAGRAADPRASTACPYLTNENGFFANRERARAPES